MILEVVKVYSDCSLSHCARWNTNLLVYGDRLQLYKGKSLLSTFYFPTSKQHWSIGEELKSLREVRVVWSDEVEFLFALFVERIDLLHVYHYNEYDLNGCAVLRDRIGGISTCRFVGPDNLLVQTSQMPERMLLWNLRNGRPFTILDCSSVQPVLGMSNCTAVLHARQRQRSGDFRDSFTVFTLEAGVFRQLRQFNPHSVVHSISSWRMGSNGSCIFMLFSMFQCKVACYSLSGKCRWEFEVKGEEVGFIADFVEVATIRVLILFDSVGRVRAIDSESGQLLSHSPVHLIPSELLPSINWQSVQIIREVGGQFVVSAGITDSARGLFEKVGMCRQVSVEIFSSNKNSQVTAAILLDVLPNVLFVFDVLSFRLKSLFIFDSRIVSFCWSPDDFCLVIFGLRNAHVWFDGQFGTFALFDSSSKQEKVKDEEQVRSVQYASDMEFFVKTNTGKTIDLKISSLSS